MAGNTGSKASVQLKVFYSYIHATSGKTTSLTISVPIDKSKFCLITFSDKKTLIRVKLSMDEIAGLSLSIKNRKEWRCFHTFKRGDVSTETRMQYNQEYINAEKDKVKIALKMTDNELASLKLVLESIFRRLL